MKIELGKYYVTRDGRKVGPMKGCTGDFWSDPDLHNHAWCLDGTEWEPEFGVDKTHMDIVSEYTGVVGKTLKDLNVQVGDIVECVGWGDNPDCDMYVGRQYEILAQHPEYSFVGMCAWREGGYVPVFPSYTPKMLFKVISKAKHKVFGEMSPEEKGALLLAHHDGETIEFSFGGTRDWSEVTEPLFTDSHAYRVKPEPKVEEFVVKTPCGNYQLMYNTINGVTDTDSVKMEKI